MTEINEEYSKTYKPGIYFIGDPCYALKKHPYWDWVCEDPGSFNAYDEFAIAPTMYGDKFGSCKHEILGTKRKRHSSSRRTRRYC